MGDSRRENAWFSLNWGILEEETRDFCLNGGFAKGKRVLFSEMGDSQKENLIFA